MQKMTPISVPAGGDAAQQKGNAGGNQHGINRSLSSPLGEAFNYVSGLGLDVAGFGMCLSFDLLVRITR